MEEEDRSEYDLAIVAYSALFPQGQYPGVCLDRIDEAKESDKEAGR